MQPDGFVLDGSSLDFNQLLAKSQHAEGTTDADPQTTAIITCPKKMVGRVIGKNGETIKALQNFTGAQIQIDQRMDPTRVSIAGPPKALITANNMVQDIVAGTFKGFAMLRAYANQSSRGGANGFDLVAQQAQAPIYIKGYGFVPPSQFNGEPDGLTGLSGMPNLNGLPGLNGSHMLNGHGLNGVTGLNGATGYADPYPGQAIQNQFAVNGGFQPYAITDPNAQYSNLALALAAQSRYNPQIPTMPAAPMGMQQIPQAPLGVQQAASSYMLNPPTGYGVREQADPASLAAQFEAMNLANQAHPLTNNTHPLANNNHHPLANNHSQHTLANNHTQHPIANNHTQLHLANSNNSQQSSESLPNGANGLASQTSQSQNGSSAHGRMPSNGNPRNNFNL